MYILPLYKTFAEFLIPTLHPDDFPLSLISSLYEASRAFDTLLPYLKGAIIWKGFGNFESPTNSEGWSILPLPLLKSCGKCEVKKFEIKSIFRVNSEPVTGSCTFISFIAPIDKPI